MAKKKFTLDDLEIIENINNQGLYMKIIECNGANDIKVQFEDGTIVTSRYSRFKEGCIKNPNFYKNTRIGEKSKDNYGTEVVIVDYINSGKVLVEFQDEKKSRIYVEYDAFKNGNIRNPNLRVGEINYNRFNIKMEIIKYRNSHDIDIKIFGDEIYIEKHKEYENFKKGSIKTVFDRNNYNVGYIGLGKYNPIKNGKKVLAYHYWRGMLTRCYGKRKGVSYKNCTVCKEWHNFQNFAKWYEENYYEIENETMNLDKDILIKGNKIYSPQTCIFVPHRINVLFVKHIDERGEYPIGVCKDNTHNLLLSQCDTIEGKIRLGYFSIDKPFQAFICYKNFKENYIKEVADEYKDLIPTKLYEAIYKYEVEIND